MWLKTQVIFEENFFEGILWIKIFNLAWWNLIFLLYLFHYLSIFNPRCVVLYQIESSREFLVSLPPPPLLSWKIPRLIWEFFYTQPAVCIAFWYYHSYNFVILGLSSRCRDAFSCPHCKAEGKLPLTITRMLLFKGLTSQIVTGGQQYNQFEFTKDSRIAITSMNLLWVFI